MEKRKYLLFTSFGLKILAIITMTIDHIGVLLQEFFNYSSLSTIITICRSIGRLALPLFCFMIVEGFLHTKSFRKYLLRLGIIGSSIFIAQLFLEILFKVGAIDFRFISGNIFIDLILGIIAIYFLSSKKNSIRLLSIIPFSIGLIAYFCNFYESQSFGNEVWIFPYFLRPDYSFFGIGLIILIYLLKQYILPCLYSSKGLDPTLYKETSQYQLNDNIVSSLGILILTAIYCLIPYIFPQIRFYDNSTQLFAVFSVVFILLYNGRIGFKSKKFQIFTYIYYPAHIVVLFLLFNLVFFIINH